MSVYLFRFSASDGDGASVVVCNSVGTVVSTGSLPDDVAITNEAYLTYTADLPAGDTYTATATVQGRSRKTVGVLDASAGLSNTFATLPALRRELFRAVPKAPLHPTPPTVTLGASNAATALTGTVVDIANNDAALTYTACVGTTLPAPWYRIGVTPNSSTLDQGAPYDVNWIVDTADFEIRLAGQSANRGFKLWVDGQPCTATTQTGPGATGGTHRLRVTFTGRAVRHVRIRTNAGFVGVSIGANDTVWASTVPLYSKRAYFLGDSFTAGASATFQQDGYVYWLSDLMGWEPMNGGELGTGYGTTGGGGGGRNTFPARVPTDVVPTAPDVVVIYGGTNDSNTGLAAAAAAAYSALATALPKVPVYVFGVQYPSGAADSVRDAKDATLAAAAAAAPNVKLFQSVKSWFTGTGRVGTTTGSGNSDIYTSSDGLHPTAAGHEAIGRRMASSLYPVYTTG